MCLIIEELKIIGATNLFLAQVLCEAKLDQSVRNIYLVLLFLWHFWQWFLLQAYHHQYSSQFLYQTNSYNQRSFVLAEHIFHRQLFSCCKHQTIKRLIRLIKINTWYDSTRVQHTLVHIYTNFRRVKSSRTMKHFTPSSLILKGPSVRQIIHL